MGVAVEAVVALVLLVIRLILMKLEALEVYKSGNKSDSRFGTAVPLGVACAS